MTEKKTITETDIISYYMEYVLEHDAPPKSVYAFAKANAFEESQFYACFGNFEAVEKAIFKAFYEHTIAALHHSTEYTNFDARNQLLSFYFTFFENLSANRSYVLQALGKHRNHLKKLHILSDLKKSFVTYVDALHIDTLHVKQQQLEQLQQKSIKESAWMQLLITLKFWMDDTSPFFEKTDIFIEKSVNTSFDVLDAKSLKSVIDFGKFLLKEKVNVNL